jgi:hypothetical protein
MSNKDNGGPAFPHEYKFGDGTAGRADGMSLRDYFAVHASETDIAVQAEILREQRATEGHMRILPDDYRSKARYMHADAMLKAKGQQ